MSDLSSQAATWPPLPTRPEGLPEYEAPPIDETAIGVHFLPVTGYGPELVGDLYGRMRGQYPIFDDSQPRIEPVIEALTSETSLRQSMTSFGISPTPGRIWLISADDSGLLQLQDNLLLCNWRRREAAYPRFEPNWERFGAALLILRAVLRDSGLPELQIRQVEVTYINWIQGSSPSDFLAVVNGTNLSDVEFLGTPEFETWQARYLLHDDEAVFGRLSIGCVPAIRADTLAPGVGYQLSFTVRNPVVPGTLTDDQLGELVHRSRLTIVKAFTALTTSEAHAAWGRTR